MPSQGENKLPPVCINHPEEQMILLKGVQKASTTQVLLLAKASGEDPIKYSLEGEATGVYVYACRLCGYCETYLTSQEREQLLNLE